MRLTEFDYDLPEELIAQHPLPGRSDSRMMVIDRESGNIEDRKFSEFADFFSQDELIVLNNTRVFPARLFGYREDGDTEVEVLLTKEIKPHIWEVMMKPARKFKIGDTIRFADDFTGIVEGRNEKGRRYIKFDPPKEGLMNALEQVGHIPLPPYIHREKDYDETADRERYQTIFARKNGSVAAPTASLHFDSKTMKQLKAKKVDTCEVTLNVSAGTFTPVNTSEIEDFKMDREYYDISKSTARRIERKMFEEVPITAVGTTVVRALESNVLESKKGIFRPGERSTDIFIYPGFEFKVVDRLLTNFHLPKSSLLMLVSAFAGLELMREAYHHAIDEGYRFYSYGDCMLIK